MSAGIRGKLGGFGNFAARSRSTDEDTDITMANDQTAEAAAPPAQAREGLSEQRVTWAELFFDLVWVFAITQIAGMLAGAASFGDVARTLLLLVPLWWGWGGVTMLGNTAGAALDGARGRMLLFILAGCGLAMSVAIPQAYGGRGLLFAGAYCVLRLVLWAAMRRQPANDGLRLTFAVSLFVSSPLFVLGALSSGGWRTAAWAAAALIEVLGPTLLRRRLTQVRFETAHLPERFGLFLIIALGETVVAIGVQASASPLDLAAGAALALGFLVIIGLWWTYFHYGASAAHYALATDPVQARIARDVFSYAHFVYVAAIICVAVGLKKTLAHPLDHPHKVTELLLAPGVGLYLLGFCYSRLRMFGAIGLTRFLAAVACLAVAVAAPFLPQLAVAAAIAVVLVVLNVVEAWRVETGRPFLLLRLPQRKP